jgi:hypothetical protein
MADVQEVEDEPGRKVSGRVVEIVSASFFVNHFRIGLFTTSPDEVAAVQNDRFMNVCDGTTS